MHYWLLYLENNVDLLPCSFQIQEKVQAQVRGEEGVQGDYIRSGAREPAAKTGLIGGQELRGMSLWSAPSGALHGAANTTDLK